MNEPSQAARGARATHVYPFWSPRFWHGMRFGSWLQLLRENRFQVHPLRWPMAGLISLVTPTNSCLALLQRLAFRSRVAATRLPHPPLFIVGHWRSGTTYLHELMVLDERFTYPTTYQCFTPEHFLVSQWLFGRYFGFLIPSRRPMDNVRAGFDRPQEDEFALLSMGIRSPYRRMAFPNRPVPDLDYLDMADLSADEINQWSEALVYFCRALTVHNPSRLVLKSPTHTGRVALLSQLFPGARFIHITRHPYSLFPSTLRLWRSLDAVQALQRPHHDDLEEYVLQAFERMYGGFDQQRGSLSDDQIVDIRYEDLVAHPIDLLQDVYQRLDLGDFGPMREVLQPFLDAQPGYRTNQYSLAPEVRDRLQQRWGDYFRRYGYDA